MCGERGRGWRTMLWVAFAVVLALCALSPAANAQDAAAKQAFVITLQNALRADDKNWLAHTMAYRTSGGLEIRKKPVTITEFEPKERKY